MRVLPNGETKRDHNSGCNRNAAEGRKASVRNRSDCTNAQAEPGQYIHIKDLLWLRMEVFLQKV